jgi:hypothetical protein
MLMRTPVRGYEGRYEIDSDGLVISLLGVSERTLKPYANKKARRNNHPRVVLHRPDDGQKTFLIHHLVADAYLPPKPSPRHELRHKNGDHSDNRAENLEWGTRSENTFDQVRDGVHNNASKTHCKNGHPFDEENTIARGERGRRCLTCQRKWAKRSRG